MFRYQPLPSSLFVNNRRRFVERMQPGAAAVFFSNDLLPVNSDQHFKFDQNSNFYYLSGIDQEKCALFLFPDAPSPEYREILFILPTSEEIQIWEGWKYSIEEAREASGVSHIRYVSDFDNVLYHLVSHIDGFFLDFNEHDRNRLHYPTAAHRFAERLRQEFPAHKLHRANPILLNLRMIKQEPEVDQMKRACDITEKAFRRVLGFVKPGILEYEIEAEIIHEFIRNGSAGHAYEPIIASGPNACVLHYGQNNAVCKDGDLILFDFGCQYGNYSSDLSRTVPVNGRFTERQLAVYNAVLRIMRACIQMLVPSDHTLDSYHKEVGKIVESELIGLGLLDKTDVANQNPDRPLYKKYFMHGASHHLGLDTHDLGSRYAKFQAGMVFTCEPGIYLPEEGFGIRIENDILVTTDGPVDLMANIPIEADEIETLMNEQALVG